MKEHVAAFKELLEHFGGTREITIVDQRYENETVTAHMKSGTMILYIETDALRGGAIRSVAWTWVHYIPDTSGYLWRGRLSSIVEA